MKAISGKKFCKIIEKNGWMLARITSSHHIYIKKSSNLRITIPVHGNKDLKIGLLKALMKNANLSEKDLL